MYNIAIDGPAGAGKSTIAKKVAKELSFVYVDTGAMFRSMALFMLRNEISLEDDDAVAKACEEINITISYIDGEQQVILNGENVSGLMRLLKVRYMLRSVQSFWSCKESLRPRKM